MLDKAALQAYAKRMLLSRMRILAGHGFYGLLLMHLTLAIDEDCETAATDGMRITFGTRFLKDLSDSELDFVMLHELLHVVLGHCLRGQDLEHDRYNIACDTVINSTIMQEMGRTEPISLRGYGIAMHLAPGGREGHLFTAEEVYEMLPPGRGRQRARPAAMRGTGRAEKRQAEENNEFFADDHSRWESVEEEDDLLRDVWVKRILDAAQAISIQKGNRSRGNLPAFAKRILGKLLKPQIDWRTILNDFVQEELCDYSFYPPDRRFSDSGFFLPDFNETEEMVRNVLFMIDSSGSMSDDAIAAAFSEVYGAIEQFGGRLAGYLGFFDAAMIEPIPFEAVTKLRKTKTIGGGGGTDFQIIFEYVARYMEEDPPASIIILTDGYAPFPKERLANGIPVLWVLNNDEVEPPWGRVARIKGE